MEDLTSASALLEQIQPKTYTYDTASYGYMGLSPAPQMGMIAQEVEAVIPEFVHHTTVPAQVDSMGNVIHPAMQIEGLDYEQFVPLLIAGWKEQQATITTLQQQVALMQTILAGCCSVIDDTGLQMMGGGGGANGTRALDGSGNNDDLLKVQPNPFGDATSITYSLGAAGEVRLIVSTTAGRQLQVLEKGWREPDDHTYEWNTATLASGLYNLMLLVDGAPVVQKAVKVAR